MTDMVRGLCVIIGNIKNGGGILLVRSSRVWLLWKKLNLDRIGDRRCPTSRVLSHAYKNWEGGSAEWGIRPHTIYTIVEEVSRVLSHVECYELCDCG